MIRNLLASTAVLALLTTGAIAADNKMKMPSDTTQTAPAGDTTGATPDTTDTAPATGDTAATPAQNDTGFVSLADDQILASTLIGKTVYGGTGENAEVIGDVNDIVMNQAGEVQGVVIGVGGFLGMGEKDVAVGFDSLQWTEMEGGDVRITLSATRQELEAAPEFNRPSLPGEGEQNAPTPQQ